MKAAEEVSAAKPKQRRRGWRRLVPRWRTLRYVLVVLILLGYAGWRYGWPTQTWETTVCPLEEIGWEEAVRLAPACISSLAISGVRHVALADGTLDDGGEPRFDLSQRSFIDREMLPLRDEILPQLKLPDMTGRRFRAGIFSVDVADEHGEAADKSIDPTLVYGVVVSCDESKRWEEGAELIVDLNRNRDLTDDPVMTLSDIWSHEEEYSNLGMKEYYRVFDPVELSRTVSGRNDDSPLPPTVRAIPKIEIVAYDDETKPTELHLAFCPASYRKGRLGVGDQARDVIVAPDRIRLGRFDGPSVCSYEVKAERSWGVVTQWRHQRGVFVGGRIDAEGRELRIGPYAGPIGHLRVRSADGEPLRVWSFDVVLRGTDSHPIHSSGWTPIPRFAQVTVPSRSHPLPVGDYSIEQLMVTRGTSSAVTIQNYYMKPGPIQFSIREGETTELRLPKKLDLEANALVERRRLPRGREMVWSTFRGLDAPTDQPGRWQGPRPGGEVVIQGDMGDPITKSSYAISYRGDPPSNAIRLTIADAEGKTVHEANMEYG
ncbi:MAG: hypothetical protein GX621_12920 [Pirellulaceae bacterium]|nr:hypothetical protein [Pirellulaceae bacterium]